MSFTLFTEDLIDQFTLTHGLIHGDLHFYTSLVQLFFRHFPDVVPGIFFNGIGHTYPPERTFKVDFIFAYHRFRSPVDRQRSRFDHLFREVHHPQIIFISHINFHTGKFRIMCPVHSLIPEIPGKFVHPFKTADNQPFQV